MGFSRLNANVWTWFGIAATLFVTVFVAIVAIGFGFISAMASALNSPPYDINVTTTIVLSGLTAALIGACGYLAFTVSLRGTLAEVDGHKPTFGAFFRDIRWGSVLLSFPIVACLWILAVLPAIVLRLHPRDGRARRRVRIAIWNYCSGRLDVRNLCG